MGILGWIVLFAVAAAVATAGQYLFLRNARGPRDHDWVYMAAGAVIGGFTGHAWYATGPAVDGLYLLPMLAGAVVGAAVLELVYRLFLRSRPI
jgi:hypothetical protein